MRACATFLFFSLSAVGLTGAQKACEPEPSVTCYQGNCSCQYCLGPSHESVNAPVHPLTCNGDLEITISGLYWKPYQDGMEYAISTEGLVPIGNSNDPFLINADYKNPSFHWDFGFQLGLGYNTPCDGWGISALWTSFHGSASSHDEAERDENQFLIALWSDQKGVNGGANSLTATDIKTDWSLKLNLIDIELGRKFWNSPRLALRPHLGFRVSYLDQNYDIFYKIRLFTTPNIVFNDEVELRNDFKGVGIRGGLDTNWQLGCGWNILGNFALSQIYGRFDVKHKEMDRQVESPFSKNVRLEAQDSFKTNVLMVDVGLGIGYAALLCDCDYALSVSLGWEQHLFLNQNQMWRVNFQSGDDPAQEASQIYEQRRGDLSTQGWTLKVVFDF